MPTRYVVLIHSQAYKSSIVEFMRKYDSCSSIV